MNSFKSGKESYDFYEHKHTIIEPLKGAGVKSSSIIRLTPINQQYAFKQTLDLFENMTAYDDEACNLMIGSFRKPIGVYKKRMIESINPLFWIEYLIFLPHHILTKDSSKGVNNTVVHIINIFYWLLSAAASLIAIISYIKK